MVIVVRQSMFLLLLLLLPAANASNTLKNHPSPYLAMHGDDPVEWRDWGEAAVEEAKVSGKLLFISSGYFSCHWCHVMQRESYRHAEIADVLNRDFVPVKIDRELQPALDAWLVTFTEATEGRAGWPLNVFLTPDGYPLVGMTYVPQPDFLGLLGRLQDFWKDERPKAVAFSRSIIEQIRTAGMRELPGQWPDSDTLAEALVTQALTLGDELQGGFGQQNKFPMAPQLSVLLELQQRQSSGELREFLLMTLDQMANRGLRDHLAGGFFRYTVDPGWETPHYEKMLYTQAMMASLYLKAAEVLQRPDYREVALDTLDFTLERMRGESGGYIASLSAVDEDGEEGGSYLWSPGQLDTLLDEQERALAQRWWQFPFGTQLPGMALPFRSEEREGIVPAGIEKVRAKLLAERETRLPPRDTKELAAWNGLLLKALADAAATPGGEKYDAAAGELANWLLDLWDGKQLRRSGGSSSSHGTASLADYLYVANGLHALGRVRGDKEVRDAAGAILEQAWNRFHNDSGWRLGEKSLIPGLEGEPAMQDGPMPSPSALAIALSPAHKRRDRALLHAAEPAGANPLWFAGHARLLINHPTETTHATNGTEKRRGEPRQAR